MGNAAASTATRLWIRNPGFDLALVTGGAFFTLAVAALAFAQPPWLPLFFWVWVVFFEGSHFWATFSRTYFDAKFRGEHRSVLLGSLVFFGLPIAAVVADSLWPPVAYTAIYGFLIFMWSLYHNARQHYGFTSIYCSKAGIEGEMRDQVVRALYLCIVFAQLHFLFNFKIQGLFQVGAPALANANVAWFLDDFPKLLTLGAVLYGSYTAVKLWNRYGSRSLPTLFYIATCAVFYSTMFYVIAPKDLFLQGSDGTQRLMLIAIMNSLFHNIQYHAIVWHYGQARYGGGRDSTYGTAPKLMGTTPRYLMSAVVMGAFFGWIVWNVGDWPGVRGSFEGVSPHTWAYVLFFGIIGHHFYLDQKIWRPSRQKDLKGYLT